MTTRIITVASQKGGVGKTSMVRNVGYELAEYGNQTLMIDFDPQADLTVGCGIDPLELGEKTILEVLENPDQLTDSLIAFSDNLALLPATLDLASAEMTYGNRIDRIRKLKKAIAKAVGVCDFILIDAPPSLGFYTANALVCANEYIVPLQVHPYAFRASKGLMEIIDLVREDENPKLKMCGVALTMYDCRNGLTAKIKEAAVDRFGEKVFDTNVPVNIKIAEASEKGLSVRQFASDSKGAVAYKNLAREILERG